VGTAEDIRLAVEIFGAILMPILVWQITRQDRDRRERFKHLDECIDATRKEVIRLNNQIAGTGVTRADLERMQIGLRAEIGMERLERERSSNGLHDRLMRLEDIQLRHREP
jgi:hypothetical protein